MENRESSWHIFEKTGSILDYLNYTACTKEEQIQNNQYHDNGDDRAYGSSAGESSWDCFVGNASGRT